MHFVNGSRYVLCRDLLLQRRRTALRTPNYVDAEVVRLNALGDAQRTQSRRSRLLKQIHEWYDREIHRIDAVLDRLDSVLHRAADLPL